MTCDKPKHIKDELWEQHLKWLELVGSQCRINEQKREREKRRGGQNRQTR